MSDFKRILEEIAEKYDCKIWISEKIGKRWSFYRDLKAGREKFLPAELLVENERFGVFAEDFPEDKKDEVIPLLKKILDKLE
jgi:histidinol phosphatase-like enzyme